MMDNEDYSNSDAAVAAVPSSSVETNLVESRDDNIMVDYTTTTVWHNNVNFQSFDAEDNTKDEKTQDQKKKKSSPNNNNVVQEARDGSEVLQSGMLSFMMMCTSSADTSSRYIPCESVYDTDRFCTRDLDMSEPDVKEVKFGSKRNEYSLNKDPFLAVDQKSIVFLLPPKEISNGADEYKSKGAKRKFLSFFRNHSSSFKWKKDKNSN